MLLEFDVELPEVFLAFPVPSEHPLDNQGGVEPYVLDLLLVSEILIDSFASLDGQVSAKLFACFDTPPDCLNPGRSNKEPDLPDGARFGGVNLLDG